MPEEHIGRRIRYWRRRRGGMTQQILADRAGLSQSYISQVENGIENPDSRSTLIAIAQALDISMAELLGFPGDPADPNKAEAVASVPEVRLALLEVEIMERPAEARSGDELAARLARIDALRLSCDFANSVPELPYLLRHSIGHSPRLRAAILHATASLLRSIGYRDLAWRASDMALAAVRESDDLSLLGPVQFTRLKCMPGERPALLEAEARRTYEELQPHTSDELTRRGYGALHLSAALVESVQKRTVDLNSHFDEAASVARSLGEPLHPGGMSMSFGPTNVDLWRMATALELGQFHRVVEISKDVDPTALRDANRISTYWLDSARALAHLPGREGDALAHLQKAKDAAPQYMRILPAARNTVSVMITRAKRAAVADDLRKMASWMGM
ncbi:helix-turn-helix domain-containing protein [Hamadaea sp. NPDC051192]|uniref:helix-turn-helix domain-containing protein n=1 Tax=Hamadaea sp. NPDC051192 TaxID=3154940 RepID=UPI00343BBAD2